MIGSQSGSTSFARLNHCMIDCGGASEVSHIMLSFRSPNLIGIVVDVHICLLLGRT